MYLLPIHVPVYVDGDGDRLYVASDWKRAVLLLRDSLAGRYGEVVVVSPSRSANEASDQLLEPVNEEGTEGVRWVASFPERCRARAFWTRYRRQWLDQLSPMIDEAKVVHAALDDVYRPIAFSAWQLAHGRGKPTVFVQDTDIVRRVYEMRGRKTWPEWTKDSVYARIYERWCRRGVAGADLSLLKGQALMERYGAYSRNARCFHNTSYRLDEVVPAETVERRLASLEGRPLRLVYCGRLVARKGLLLGLEVVHRATQRGMTVEWDIIGDGEQRGELERKISELGLESTVRLLGRAPYNTALIQRLADYDAILFTPLGEDTPRMIFDGYAAGLPLLGVGIAYVKERADEDQAACVLPADADGAADTLMQLDRDRPRLAALSRAAHKAGLYHASDNWYQRRAEWTHEAIDRHNRARSR